MSILPIRMPKWGLAMTEGTVTAWHVATGQNVASGAELCDIETAKIVNALEAPVSGMVARLLVEAGDVVSVGRLIAVLVTEGEPAAEVDARIALELAATPDPVASAAPPPLGEAPTSAGPVAYRGEGDPAAPPVVFLHGFGGSHAGWDLTQSAVATRYRTIAVDLPGHGASTRGVGDGSAERLAEILGEALDSLCPGPVRVVAHSFGASVALPLLASGREVVAAAFIAPAGFGARVDHNYVLGFAESRRKRDLRPLMERLFAQPGSLGREMVTDALTVLDDTAARAALRLIASGIVAAEVGAPLAVTVPWRVIWGGRDRIIPLRPDLAMRLGDRLTLLPESGHLPQIEDAATTNAWLLEVLEG